MARPGTRTVHGGSRVRSGRCSGCYANCGPRAERYEFLLLRYCHYRRLRHCWHLAGGTVGRPERPSRPHNCGCPLHGDGPPHCGFCTHDGAVPAGASHSGARRGPRQCECLCDYRPGTASASPRPHVLPERSGVDSASFARASSSWSARRLGGLALGLLGSCPHFPHRHYHHTHRDAFPWGSRRAEPHR